MIFYGSGGHAKVVIEAWIASGGAVTAVMDDNEALTQVLSYSVERFDSTKLANHSMVISIGQNETRKRLSGLVKAEFGLVMHPTACISKSAKVGEGSVILAGAIVNADTRIGNHAIINTSAVAEHDSIIGDFAHISPKATLCGGVIIGEGTQVGAGATVIPGVTIGKWAVIGAGSVIIRDVADYSVVAGVPGKIIGKNKAAIGE